MKNIRLIPDEDLGRFLEILGDAYPGFDYPRGGDLEAARKRMEKKNLEKRASIWGYYRNNQLLGGIRFLDYTMNLFGNRILAGGGAGLGVDLLHKKEHIAREVMEFFFKHYRRKNSPVAVLWPFRPDFYRQMGCGYGSKIREYRVRPADLPRGAGKKHMRFLKREDMKAANDCFNRYALKTTGMIEETLEGRLRRFDLSKALRYVGYVRDGKVLGYFLFKFERGSADNPLDNNIVIPRIIYESPEVLSEMMTFLHSQLDQIERVVFYTSDDEFHFAFHDPRNGANRLMPSVYHECNVAGVGLMYRVINTRLVFEVLANHNFGGQNLKLKLRAKDSFLKANDSSLVIHFRDGKPKIKSLDTPYQVQIDLDIADFSSMLLGSVKFGSLYNYGLATISDPRYVDQVNRLFATDKPPICMTDF